MRDIPPVFKRFVSKLYHGSLDGYPGPREWIDHTLRFDLNDEERLRLRFFLEQLLVGKPTEAELQDIYESTDPDYHFVPVEPILQLVRENLTKIAAQPG